MSEKAKTAVIQEELKQAKFTEQLAEITVSIGVVLAAIGFAFAGAKFIMAVVGISGVVIAVLAFVYVWHYANQRKELTKQLKTMTAQIPKCPKCGKQIPEGNHAFCPFCGSPLSMR